MPANLPHAVVSKHSSPRLWTERTRSHACGVQLRVGGLGPATHSRGRPGQSARPDVCALTVQWRGRRGQSVPPWEREACWASGWGHESLRGIVSACDLLRALALLPGNPWSLVSGLGGPHPPSLNEPSCPAKLVTCWAGGGECELWPALHAPVPESPAHGAAPPSPGKRTGPTLDRLDRLLGL